MPDFPISSFEQDKKLDYKLGARSVVANAMVQIHAIAAWYEDGDYWFVIQGQSRPWRAGDLAYYGAYHGDKRMKLNFEAIKKLAEIFKLEGYPPSPPIFDPIYFGT